MPHLDEPLFSTRQDEVLTAIEDGVVGRTVALDVLVSCMAVHGFEVHEAVDSLVALIFSLEGVLKDLADIELIKIGALNWPFGVLAFYSPFESLLAGIDRRSK